MDSSKFIAEIAKKVAAEKKSTTPTNPEAAQVSSNPSPNLPMGTVTGGSSSSIEVPNENRVQKFQRIYKDLMMKQKSKSKKKRVATKKPKADLEKVKRVTKETGISSTEPGNESSGADPNVDEVITDFLSSIAEEVVTEEVSDFGKPWTPGQELTMVVYNEPKNSQVVEEVVDKQEDDVEIICEGKDSDEGVEPILKTAGDTREDTVSVEKVVEQENVTDSVKDKADPGSVKIVDVEDSPQTEKTTEDSEFIEILEQADAVACETIQKEKKRKLKSTTATRRSTRQKVTDPEPEKLVSDEPIAKTAKLDTSKPSGSKQPTEVGGAVTGVVVKGVWFESKQASERWSLIQKRKIVAEGVFQENKWFVPEVVQMLEDANLLNALRSPAPFCEKLVREVVVNITEEFGDILEEGYGKVSVRGHSVSITPEAINKFLGISISAAVPNVTDWNKVASIMTNGKVSKWRGLTLESKNLTTLYAALHGICMRNWIPGTHRTTISKPVTALLYTISQGIPVDLGGIIFDQLANHALSKSPIHPIGHPSLLYQMILMQVPELHDVSAILTSPKPLVTDWKLFTFNHYVDVTIPETIMQALQRQGKLSEMAPGKVKKEKKADMSVIKRLKEHLKLLDQARNDAMELISLLEQDESQEGGEDVQEEADPEDSEAET